LYLQFCKLLIRKSWIVFVQAVILSVESIIVEFLTTNLGISSLVTAGTSIPIAGATILFVTNVILKQKITIFKSWKLLLIGSLFLAAAVFTWYDSVSRVGASKEGLLAGPLETVIVLIFAWLLLKEKLRRLQLVGVIIALIGFFTAVSSGSSNISSAVPVSLTFGDFEAIVSAFAFAAGIILMTKLVETHSPLEVSGASLLISGLILAVIMSMSTSTSNLKIEDWAYLIVFSLVPLLAALLYVIGLSRIGASLTSTIASSNILLTLLFQLVFRELGLGAILPQNIPLAVTGATIGIFGIYIIHVEKNILSSRRAQ
jgi:drug/metabolite transporter (DMT)-like permease